MIIGASGYAHGGKDTLATHLAHRYGYTRTRFAGEIKATCQRIFAFSDEQIEGALKETPDPRYPMPGVCPACNTVCSADDGGWYCEACRRLYLSHLTPRLAMQVLGVSLRALYADVWLDATLRQLDRAERWVICDVRFPNEAQAIRARGGRVIRLLRGAPESTHPSETALDGRSDLFDAVIDNRETSIDELHAAVDALMDGWRIRPVLP